MESETQALSIRLPADIHRAARLKSVRTRKSINEIVVAKIEEWLNEPESDLAPKPEPRAPKQAKAKLPKAA